MNMGRIPFLYFNDVILPYMELILLIQLHVTADLGFANNGNLMTDCIGANTREVCPGRGNCLYKADLQFARASALSI